jgi:hypothetical protein
MENCREWNVPVQLGEENGAFRAAAWQVDENSVSKKGSRFEPVRARAWARVTVGGIGESATALASNNKHGKPTVPVQRPTPKDRFPSTHHRTCKRWQDIYLEESVPHYRQPSYIPSNRHREKEREGAWSRTLQSCQFGPISPQIQLEPSTEVSDTRTTSLVRS